MVHVQCSLTYFKHAVFGLRYWFRLFGMEDKALRVPPVKKEKKLPIYLDTCKPQTWLFEGNTPGQPMGERSIQYIIGEALPKTNITKQVSMHTLRHSFATHLLEDGIDIHTIQHLLGHADLVTTMVYLHVAQVKMKAAHSPLDSLYNLL